MPDYITTYTGIHFYPTAPKAEDIDILDIAHSLSLQCRGNGHVRTFLSVGQHCIRCAEEALARGYSNRVALICLLHDGSEAYMSDVPRPTKREIPMYSVWEERLLEVIYRKFLGDVPTEEELAVMKEIDDDVLYYDLLELLGEQSSRQAPEIKVAFDYKTFVPFAEVEKRYLELFEELLAERRMDEE